MTDRLLEIYDRLQQKFGPQHWWPAETPFEVVVGAILTQNTNWSNVEKAMANLRRAERLSLEGMKQLQADELEALIRPSGFFRQKAERLQAFTCFVLNCFDGNLDNLFDLPIDRMRRTLLAQPGIGPETADSIILYAAGKASFVVDAYTRRIFSRLGLLTPDSHYDQTRTFFMENLEHKTDLFNEYHALIVRLAKTHCKKNSPLCAECPLLDFCQHGQTACWGLTRQ